MKQIIRDYEGNKVRIVEEGELLWFAAVDIASILGHKNQRNMVTTLHDELDEKKFEVQDTRGRKVNINHISLPNVKMLIEKSSYGDKSKLSHWVDFLLEPIIKDALRAAGASSPMNSSAISRPQDEEPETPASRCRNKRKPISKLFAIKASNYAILLGKSKSSVYNRIQNGKLKTEVIQGSTYICIPKAK